MKRAEMSVYLLIISVMVLILLFFIAKKILP